MVQDYNNFTMLFFEASINPIYDGWFRVFFNFDSLKKIFKPQFSLPQENKAKYAIVFIYHKDLHLCMDKIKMLRLFNPHVPIHGIFGGNSTDIKHYRKMESMLDSNWQHPEPDGWWKWANLDVMVTDWYSDVGKGMRWDYLYVLFWDLQFIDSLANIIQPQAQDEVVIYPALESYYFHRAYHNTLMADYNGYFKQFRNKLRKQFDVSPTVEESIYFSNCFFMSWPRAFLKALEPLHRSIPGMFEYRLPTLIPLLNFKVILPKNIAERDHKPFCNTSKKEIPTYTIIQELERANAFPVFHPVFTAFNTSLLKKYFAVSRNRVKYKRNLSFLKRSYRQNKPPSEATAILFFYQNPSPACLHELHVLRQTKPHVRIYGIFAGAALSYDRMMEMASCLDDHWCYLGNIDQYWKQENVDVIIASWFLDRGKNLAWEFLFFYPVELELNDGLRQPRWDQSPLLPTQNCFSICPAPKIESVDAFIQDKGNTHKQFQNVIFKELIISLFGYQDWIWESGFTYIILSRKALETIAPLIPHIPGRSYFRLPTILTLLGFDFSPLSRR